MTDDLSRLESTVRRALAATLEDETDLHLRVSVMLASGVSRQEVQQRLGLTGDDLKAIQRRLRRCAHMMGPTASAAPPGPGEPSALRG
jgi:hypothetical protein